MSRSDTADEIVSSVLNDLAGRRGCNIEELVDDNRIYNQIKFDLWEIVDKILFNWEREKDNS